MKHGGKPYLLHKGLPSRKMTFMMTTAGKLPPPPAVHEPSDVNEEDPEEIEAPTRIMQLELERTARIDAYPRSRSERAQVAKAFTLNTEDDADPEEILLAVSEPVSYNQAMKTPEKPMWKKAVEAE